MWVRFTGEFLFRPPEKRNSLKKYREGHVQSVRRICGEEAIRKGLAVEIEGWQTMRRRAREELANGRS